MTDEREPVQTTDAGIPVESDKYSLTVGAGGPILLQDSYLIEQMAQWNRERIPERQPHAKGSGAFGRLEITKDVSAYTKAALFQPNTTTPLGARFSTVAGERGSPDLWRDLRGFALKFYTSEGNYDMVGNATPVFFIRDPIHFQNFIRSQKRRIDNNLRSNDMQWDFWTLLPETAHQVVWLMGDRGLPKSWRHMNGYSSHTYMWINEAGQRFWVKYHFKTDQGIEFFTDAQAANLVWSDYDYHTRDLFEAIARGEYPSWTMYVQIMPFDDAPGYRFNPFDLTKVWPHGGLPAGRGGAVHPGPQPGRQPHRDGAVRAVAEQHGARHRAEPGPDAAGAAVLLRGLAPLPAGGQLPADPGQRAGRAGAHLQQGRRDAGGAAVRPGVLPELQGRPAAYPERYAPPSWYTEGDIMRTAFETHAEDDDFGQVGTLVRQVMDDAARDRLVANTVAQLSNGVTEPVLLRAFDYLRKVDQSLGDRVEKGVRQRPPA